MNLTSSLLIKTLHYFKVIVVSYFVTLIFNLIVSLQTRHIFFQMEVLVCRAERL